MVKSQNHNLEGDLFHQDTKVYDLGSLNMSIYRCISDHFVTDQVVITQKQFAHIRERRPETGDTVHDLKKILEQPDYIIKDNRPDTGLVIKEIISGKTHALLVLRLSTSRDEKRKNSVITSWKISNVRLKNYLNNKEILYKRESLRYD